MLSQFVFVAENENQMSFYPFVPHEISVLVELILGHLRYLLTDVCTPSQTPHLTMSSTWIDAEAPWGQKEDKSRFQLMEKVK